MKKWIWSLLLFWPLNLFAATVTSLPGLYRNSTGTALDSVYVSGVVSDSLLLRGIKLDSIRYIRFRGTTIVDSTKVAFGADSLATNPTNSYWLKGFFRRAFRASDASGNVGQYIVHAKVYSHDQSSANWEENYVWNYMVVTDPPGDVDTSDVSLAAKGSNGGTIVTGSDDRVILSNSALHGGAAFLLTGDRMAFTSTLGAAWSLTGQGGGAGLFSVGGATGAGIRAEGGATGDGFQAIGGATAGEQVGFRATGGPSGRGFYASGGTTAGEGFYAFAQAGGSDGFAAQGNGAGSGAHLTGGATGHGLLSAGIGGHGALFTGGGAFDGVRGIGGATGHGLAGIGGAISGNGILGSATLLGGGFVGTPAGASRFGFEGTIQDSSGVIHVYNPVTTTAADKQALRDSLRKTIYNTSLWNLAPNWSFELDDSTGPGQTPQGWITYSGSGSQYLLGQGGAITKPPHGRYAFAAGAASLRTDSSIFLRTGEQVYFGAMCYFDTTVFTVTPQLFLISGANEVDLFSTNAQIQARAVKRQWVLFDTVWTVSASGRYALYLTGEASAGDTVAVDIIVVRPWPVGDTAASARAAWDNDVVAEGNRTGRMHIFKTDTVQARTFPTDTVKTLTDPVAATAVLPDIDNLVRNPHFETGSGALPQTGWQAIGGGSSISAVLPNSGTKALRKFGITGGAYSDSIYLAAGSNVEISGRIRTSHVASTDIQLLKAGASVPEIKAPAQVANSWHTVTASGRIDFAGFYNLFCTGPSSGASDSAWFDDVAVRAFPDTLGLATTQQAIISGTFIDTIFTRNISSGVPVPNVAVLIRTLAGADWGQIITGTDGKKAVGFNAGTYLLYPGFSSGINWQNTDNPDTFVVTGNGQTDTIRGTTFSPSTPPDVNLCTVFGWISHQGKPLSGATVRFSLVGDTLKAGSWLIVNKDRDTLTNAAGYFEIPLLINSLLTPANTRYTMSVIDAYGVEVRRIENLVIPNQTSFQVNR